MAAHRPKWKTHVIVITVDDWCIGLEVAEARILIDILVACVDQIETAQRDSLAHDD